MLEMQCNFAGEVIPKLSKIYDGVESLDNDYKEER